MSTRGTKPDVNSTRLRPVEDQLSIHGPDLGGPAGNSTAASSSRSRQPRGSATTDPGQRTRGLRQDDAPDVVGGSSAPDHARSGASRWTLTSEQPAAVLDSVLDGLRRPGTDIEQDVLVLVVDCGDLTVTPELGAQPPSPHPRQAPDEYGSVLLTRSDPPLPLHLFRLAGTVAEIRAADLAFTTDEAIALMQYQKLDLAPSEVAELQNRTDGWPAGLMFAAMYLAGKTDSAQAIREFRGDAGSVSAYLMSEVLDAQPSALRDFLLRTCIVDEIRPALAQALTGSACDHRSLEFMAHGNSFIQPVPGTWRLLTATSRCSGSSFARNCCSSGRTWSLHCIEPPPSGSRRTVSGWRRSGTPSPLGSGATPPATWWTTSISQACSSGDERQLLTALFADLPDNLDGAEAAVVRAARALSEFDVVRCTAELGKARESLGPNSSAQTRASELAITMLQAVSACLDADVETGLDAALSAESALSAASPTPVTAHPELKLLVAGCKGRVLLAAGGLPVRPGSPCRRYRGCRGSRRAGRLGGLPRHGRFGGSGLGTPAAGRRDRGAGDLADGVRGTARRAAVSDRGPGVGEG